MSQRSETNPGPVATGAKTGQEPAILFLGEAPTQWQAPLFRYLSRSGGFHILASFRRTSVSVDPELGRRPGWGHDLLAGYQWEVQPKGRRVWIAWGWRIVRDSQWQVIVVPGWSSSWARLILAFGLICRMGRRMVVFTDSTNLTSRRRLRDTARSWMLRALAARGLTFAVPGELAAQHLLERGIPENGVVRLPYAVDNDRFRLDGHLRSRERESVRREWGVDANETVFLCVAKFSRRESPENAVRAFCATAQLWDQSHLVLVGDGPERSQIEHAAGPHLEKRVHLVGYVDYEYLPRCYWAADVFVHLPTREPWGLSINEAVAAGLPIITSTAVGASFDLVEETNGYITDGSQEGVKTAMDAFLSRPAAERDAMCKRSRLLSERVDYARWAEGLSALSPS